jgi:hypothetical protein
MGPLSKLGVNVEVRSFDGTYTTRAISPIVLQLPGTDNEHVKTSFVKKYQHTERYRTASA